MTCIGRFRSLSLVGERADYSELTVIWFQPQFALPIDTAVRAQLEAIDWPAHATDFEL